MSVPTLTHTAPVVPASVQRITVQDSVVAAAWGFTDWYFVNALTDSQRVDCRDRVAYAPNVKTGK